MISVCMATYNGGKYIREQIDSILPQLSSTDELIISDDGSTDDTVKIIQSYNNPIIKLFQFQRNKTGLTPVQMATTNFENALKQAKGDVIFLSDQDDVWLPEKVQKSLYYLYECNYDYIESSCYVVDSDLKNPHPSSVECKNFNKWFSIFGYAPFRGCLSAFKRHVLEVALPFPKNLQSHDRWIAWVACFKFNSKIIIPERLIKYRRHSDNISSTKLSSGTTLIKGLATRLYYAYYLFKRLCLNN